MGKQNKAKQVGDKIQEKAREIDHKIQEVEKGYLADRSELGIKQREELEQLRKQYFQAVDNSANIEKEKAFGALGIKLHNTYLPHVSEVYEPLYDVSTSFRDTNRIVYFDITRWVNDTEEKNIDKLINVYQVLANESCNIALIYDRKIDCCKVTMAIVNTGKSDMLNIAMDYRERVIEAIYGNFPGAEIKKIDLSDKGFGYGIPECLKKVVRYKDERETELVSAESVAIVTNLATDKSEDFISQSMEKLLDGIVPEREEQEYRLILLASPSDDIAEQKNQLYDMYNSLSPYASWQESYSELDNTTIGAGSSLGKSISGSIGIGASSGVSAGIGVNASIAGIGGGASTSVSTSTSINAGVNFGANVGKTANYNVTVGTNKGETRTCTNYVVKHSLDLLEEKMKRLEQCSAFGMWKFAAYAISKDAVTANNVATMYLALTQGETSYLSQSAINFWHGTKRKDAAAIILETLKRIQQPQFILKSSVYRDVPDIMMFPESTSLHTLISGKELVRALNFPRKSVAGFPVIESVSFGRETQKFSVSSIKGNVSDVTNNESDEVLDIGNVVHMYRAEYQRVELDVNSLASHVFITGSTGTGKSNTVYQILDGLLKLDKKVMVIEPAKGEYKYVLGGQCKTYGTNPKISDLLRINPFSFPTGDGVDRPIHVLEHIDRLIEIMNACWPMYAAMPAVLKDAVEMAYINKGWDLQESECYPLRFPTFADLLVTLPEVMKSSLYSQDTQSDYAGALVTRVKSLTNGINGLVLCASDSDVLTDSELFEQNVIVDISRVGSSETKALLMGLLIMKLQEYHMSSSRMNEDLQHMTVIEEAHNLLRRTSFGQGQDSANLQGKSVEMITNSIAEMRTYGEGFIIADQAPGLLDEAVIRNTNTKIILRLPDAEDRLLVGKAAALSDTQINELARLPRGVAAIYQNDWVEAVLCQFEKFESKYQPQEKATSAPSKKIPTEIFWGKLFGVNEDVELQREEVDKINEWINNLTFPSSTKQKLRMTLLNEKLTESEKMLVAYNLFKGKHIAKMLRDSINEAEDIINVDIKISELYDIQNDDLVVVIRQLILGYVAEHTKTDVFENRYLEFMGRGLV